MNWREKIVVDWPDDLQKNHRARQALAELDKAINDLAGLGHPLHVEEGYVSPPPPGWPRAMFHLYAPPRAVSCQADLDELGPDWYPTMEEARYAAGYTKQMQRGGIFDRALPQMLTQTPQQIQQNISDAQARREQQREFVASVRSQNREGFHANGFTVDRGEDHEPTYTEAIQRLVQRQ